MTQMVEEDRVRTDRIAAFRVELEEMTAMLAGYEDRLSEMTGVMQEAVEQSKQKLEADGTDSDDTLRESRLNEKIRLEKVYLSAEACSWG